MPVGTWLNCALLGSPRYREATDRKSLDLCFRQLISSRDRELVLQAKAPGSPKDGAAGNSFNATGEEPQENTGREQQESIRYARFS